MSIAGRILVGIAVGLGAAPPAAAAVLCGDFNNDESISAPDALGALRAAVRLVECQRAVCDFSGDNRITSTDAQSILRTAVGTGPEPKCPAAGCNGPECHPTCAADEPDCCDDTTCSGNGECQVEEGIAVCTCKEGWVGATCNAEADRYPFAEEPDRDPPVWTTIGDVLVRPASYGEQMRHDLRPGTFFIANAKLRAQVEDGDEEAFVPFVFPDGQLDGYPLELKDKSVSDVLLVERRVVEESAKVTTRNPEVTIYRSLYETDGSIRSLIQVLAVDEGGFVVRGLARHESNFPNHSGVFGVGVRPVRPTMELDDILPVNGTIDESTLLVTEAFFANSHQAGLFDDCDGLAICSDLCADVGLDQGDPGPACPPPPDPCEHVSPCGEGHGGGEPPATHHCNDGEDNDGDELVDGFDPQCGHYPTCQPGGDIPFHVHRFEAGADFGMFGDVLWCTKKGTDWPSDLLDRGYYTETPYHKDTG